MLQLNKWVDAPARVLMSLLFLYSGVGKIMGSAATETYMQSFGVPGLLVWPAAAWEIGGGLLLAIGLWTRPISFLMAGWCLLTALIFHTNFADSVMRIMLLKNLAMAGGFLLLAKSGASGWSVDGLRSSRE